jgi:acyl carrier protein
VVTNDQALQLIQESLDSLHESGIIPEAVRVDEGAVLLGTGSVLDSIGFVTFVTEVEDRLQRDTGTDHFLVLADIHEFNAGESYLSAGSLARYISHLLGDSERNG